MGQAPYVRIDLGPNHVIVTRLAPLRAIAVAGPLGGALVFSEGRTGIKERHILKGEGLGTSDMAVKAVEGLLKKNKYQSR